MAATTVLAVAASRLLMEVNLQRSCSRLKWIKGWLQKLRQVYSLPCVCLCSYFDCCQQIKMSLDKSESSKTSQDLEAESWCSIRYQSFHKQRKVWNPYMP